MIMTSLSKAGLYCAQRVLIQARLTGIERRTEPSHEYRSIDLTDHEIKCKAFLHHTSELWDILDRIETHPPHPVEVVCIPVCLNGQTYLRIEQIDVICGRGIINAMRLAPKLYVPHVARPELGQLIGMIDNIESKALRTLLNEVFSDHDVMKGYVRGRGSWNHHHAYPGGLLVHSVEVATLAASIAQNLNADRFSQEVCLVVGLLHDLGKSFTHYSHCRKKMRLDSLAQQHEMVTIDILGPVLNRLRRQFSAEVELVEHLIERFATAPNKWKTKVIVEDIIRRADALSTINTLGLNISDGHWKKPMNTLCLAANDEYY